MKEERPFENLQTLHQWLDQSIHQDFERTKRVLTFEEYLAVIAENPAGQLRGSAQYMADMMDHFGRAKPADPSLGSEERFKVFDATPSSRKVVGLESVQHAIYNSLRTFQRQGFNNKLILLHGPNGSAKTSLIQALMTGMERYSRTNEGATYTFNWIFPHEKVTKGSFGLAAQSSARDGRLSSYAKLPDEDVAARIASDLRDHPFLLIPIEQRRDFLAKLIGRENADALWATLPHTLTRGDLNPRCKEIANALLTANDGDFKKVLMHVQIERHFFSRRYRKGLVTVEPQLHVDAQFNLLAMNRNYSNLPASLQSLNLFTLSGDLIDGNRGCIEYSDLLKRPVDSFKYLLVACETGAVNVGPAIVSLDTVFLGSCNDLQLDAFKEFPDFMSFKARMELVRVPYLLRVSEEREIYQEELGQVGQSKAVLPHTDWALASWAVLSRLKKPNSINYPPGISSIVAALTPLDKSKLLDRAEMPVGLGPEDRKVLRGNLKRVREEYQNVPYYEGRIGASAREVKSILFSAAQNPDFPCLSPLSVLREMEDFVKRTSEYEFLRQDVKDGYHDCGEFIQTVRSEYLNVIDREVRDCIGLYDSAQWEDFIRRYVQHLSLVLKKEKHKNALTGKMEDPDYPLIEEFEKIIDAPTAEADLANFRNGIISQIGAWSLDHRNETVVYSKVFPEYWRKLEKHYYQSQKDLLTKMHDALLLYGREGSAESESTNSAVSEGQQLAKQTIENMKKKLGYTEEGAKEVITFLMKSRYH
jgi:predicted Ser/Thr protein kinase